MFMKACLVIVLGGLSVSNAQIPFCSGDLCFTRPDNSAKTWIEAQRKCRGNNLTLPVADNPNRQTSFVDALSYFQLNGRDVWLGATASDYGSSNWRWLDGNQYAGTDVQERGEYNKSYAYIAKRTTEVLAYASQPNNSYSYICQCKAINPDVCTNGTGRTAFVKDNRCYLKYEEKLPWFSARNKCLENNCDLASFSQLSLLDGMIDASGFWVGLRHSQWNWLNAVTGSSSDVTFTSWRIGQPNNAVPHCMATDSGDFPSWKDFDCTQVYPYICQVNVSDTMSSSTPYSSSTTTTTTSTSSTSTTTSTTTTKSPLGTPGTAGTSTRSTTSRSLSSPPIMSTTLHTAIENAMNSTNAGSANVALAIGLGVGLGVPLVILIVVVIVVAAVRRRKHQDRELRRNGAEFESGETKIANSKEISSPTSALPTVVESDANDHYQTLQNRYELQEQQQYEQLPQTPQ